MINLYRTIVLAALLLVAGASYAEGPTKEQTVLWLTGKIAEMSYTETAQGEGAFKAFEVLPEGIKFGDAESYLKVYWDDVQSVTTPSDKYLIVVKANQVFCVNHYGCKDTVRGFQIVLRQDLPERQRLAKALRHIATISGATVAQDDLF